VPIKGREILPGGNAPDAAILTPSELWRALDEEFHFDYDPCPFPRPEGFDGTTLPWGRSNYVNPPFGPPGFTAWARKALAERDKGNTTVLTMPVYGWIARLLEAKVETRVRRDWYWETPGGERRKPSQPLVVWVVRPRSE
jgi:hypothetical protein